MDDKEWKEFKQWWKERWPESSPDKTSICVYLEWQEARMKNAPWKWEFEKKE